MSSADSSFRTWYTERLNARFSTLLRKSESSRSVAKRVVHVGRIDRSAWLQGKQNASVRGVCGRIMALTSEFLGTVRSFYQDDAIIRVAS